MIHYIDKVGDFMYQYLGDTNILMYDLINNISIIALVLINLLFYKTKVTSLGRISLNLSASFSKKHKYPHIEIFLAIIEILFVSLIQYGLGGSFNRAFGNLVGTGSNYFAMLFLSPVFVAVFCLFAGIDVFKQMDIITPAYPFTMIFVRLACFCQGCCSGFACDFGLYNHSTGQNEIPLQLVEMFTVLAIFIFLMFRRKKAKEGTMFPTYLIIYSATRFFSEFLSCKENIFLIFKRYHILCLVGIAVGVIQLFVVKNYKNKIGQFYSIFFDALESIYNEILVRAGIKSEKNITHHSKNKKKQKQPAMQNTDNSNKISDMKRWILIWSLGLMGQIGWNIESTWFSTYIYEKIDKSPTAMTPMLYLGALASTVAVFLFGTVSDRTGKRRTMISYGFIIWGMLSICFSFTQFLPKVSLSLAFVFIIIIDMLISFFAGMSVSVGFNTWITDILNKKNSGQIGGALAAQTVLGSLLANVVGGLLIGENNNYIRLFVISGIVLIFVGLLSKFLFDPKDDVSPSVRGSFFNQLSELLDYKNLIKQKELVWVNITVILFFMGFSSYFPHLGNFLTQYLGYSAEKMGIIEAIPMVTAIFITLPISKLINKNKFISVAFISIVLGLIGSFSIFTISPQSIDITKYFNATLYIGIFFVASSYIIMLQATKTWTKNLYPKESKGQYEGLWAISYALIPMFFGSNIGEWVIKNEGLQRFNELTQRYEYFPNQKLFLIGTLISALSIIPIILAKKYFDRKTTDSDTAQTKANS